MGCGHAAAFRETCRSGTSVLQLPEGRPISGKAAPMLKKELASIQNFGENKSCQTLVFPGFAGHRPAFQRRVLCFWV
jgi:hypothetical protein